MLDVYDIKSGTMKENVKCFTTTIVTFVLYFRHSNKSFLEFFRVFEYLSVAFKQQKHTNWLKLHLTSNDGDTNDDDILTKTWLHEHSKTEMESISKQI